jgi:hypothetical protein
MRTTIPLLLLLLLAPTAQAAFYKCTFGDDASPLFTDNNRRGKCVRLDVDSGPARTVTESPRKRASSNPSPTNFPKVDKSTQSKRDDVRRSLLLEERRSEESALAAVLATLTGKARNPGDQAKLQENRRLHEKNIEMLDKELSRIK